MGLLLALAIALIRPLTWALVAEVRLPLTAPFLVFALMKVVYSVAKALTPLDSDRVENSRARAVIVVVLYTTLAVLGYWLFWTALPSESAWDPALVGFGLGVGAMTGAAAIRRAMRLIRPGVLEQVEYDEWLRASAQYREPGPFRVVLESSGRRQIDVVKVIREVTGLDVGRAKDMAGATPTLVSQSVSAESADRIAQLLRDAGASVRVESVDDGPKAATSP